MSARTAWIAKAESVLAMLVSGKRLFPILNPGIALAGQSVVVRVVKSLALDSEYQRRSINRRSMSLPLPSERIEPIDNPVSAREQIAVAHGQRVGRLRTRPPRPLNRHSSFRVTHLITPTC